MISEELQKAADIEMGVLHLEAATGFSKEKVMTIGVLASRARPEPLLVTLEFLYRWAVLGGRIDDLAYLEALGANPTFEEKLIISEDQEVSEETIPSYVTEWCDRHQHTEPHNVDGQWRAFPLGGVMSVPVTHASEVPMWSHAFQGISITSLSIAYDCLQGEADRTYRSEMQRLTNALDELSARSDDNHHFPDPDFSERELTDGSHIVMVVGGQSNWIGSVDTPPSEDYMWATDPMDLWRFVPGASLWFDLAEAIDDFQDWVIDVPTLARRVLSKRLHIAAAQADPDCLDWEVHTLDDDEW